MPEQLTLYEYTPSGNSYKVLLTAHLLGIPLQREFVDINRGETHTQSFLKRNPAGQVPVLQLQDGSILTQSHAIMWYLAFASKLIPTDQLEVATVLQWMNFEQHNIEPTVGLLRRKIITDGRTPQSLGNQFHELAAKGVAALGVLEQGLTGRDFLVGGRLSLADIALFAYVHCTEDSTLSLAPFTAIRRWIENVQAVPKFKALQDFQREELQPLATES